MQRSTVDELVTEIRRNIGEPTASQSHITDANLYKTMNRYLQQLTSRMSDVLRAEGRMLSAGALRFPMWFTTWNSTTSNAAGTLVVTAGSSTVYLPDNLDHWRTFYDNSAEREIYPIDNPISGVTRLWQYKNAPSGSPEVIHITGYTTNTYWVRQCTLYPSTPSGVTPNITLHGWRTPAPVTDSANYLDIDPKFEETIVMGVAAQLLRKSDPNYSKFEEKERSLLLNLANTLRAA